MRFRIPPHLKETVNVMRESAFERNNPEPVAEGVKCMIAPGKDLVHLESGVPVQESDWIVLLELPNSAITEGDFLVFAEGSGGDFPEGTELKVHGIRSLKNGHVMLLEINDVTVP